MAARREAWHEWGHASAAVTSRSSQRMAEAKKKKSPRRRRFLRVLGHTVWIGALLAVALWIAIQRVPWLGPALADGTRSVLGPRAVARVEDVAYGFQDWVDRFRYRDAPPKTYWTAPSASAPPAAPVAAPEPADAGAKHFPPPSFTPPQPKVALAGDGTWLPIADPDDASGTGSPSAAPSPPLLYKALVHPDARRSYAAVALVALDLERVELHAIPGFAEPASTVLHRSQRPGVVPDSDTASLVAAFNGGWQAVHGHYGMMVDGATLLPPRPRACTIAIYKDGAVRIHPWSELSSTEPEMAAYRQTPPCLVQGGVVHPGLAAELTTNWGAAIDGQTVIRRSALGIDASGTVLFYGMGDGLTAGSIARALAAAGAVDVAQLDVNGVYPRFLLYGHAGDGSAKVSEPLIPGMLYKPTEYVGAPEYRDFFYVTRRSRDAKGARRAATP